MIDITDVIVALVGLGFAVLSTFLIPYVRQKLSAAQLDQMRMWVRIAVKAAEMLFVGEDRGAEKKAYVVEFLESKGFKIDLTSVENMIESEVLDLKNSMAE